MAVVVIGLEHSRAPFDLLERCVVPEAEVGKVLTELGARENFHEVALVSTCLRTEIYAVVDRFHDAVDDVMELLAERSGAGVSELEENQSVYFDRGVATHLFKVASGLESAVPGEPEVLGQVRRAMERAADEGTIGPTLTTLFRSSISTGRKVRTETGIARGTTSFSHASIELAEAHLGADLEGATVLLLGAGELSSGILASLVDERRTHRCGEVVVLNRTVAAAEELAARHSGAIRVRAGGLEDLSAELGAARMVVCAVETEEPVVLASMVPAGARLFLDLGMPRNVHPEVAGLSEVEVLDIGHLRSVVEAAREERRAEMTAAQSVVNEEVERYLDEQRGRGAAPMVVALRERLEVLRLAELERRGSDLAGLSEAERELLDAVTRSLMAKVAHEPTIALKESAGTMRGERLMEAARDLFGL
jgi:glutamyl-tRNA reductase